MSTATEPQIDADQLQVSRIRALRGPNYWRLAPVIACDVQLGGLEQISSADILVSTKDLPKRFLHWRSITAPVRNQVDFSSD